MKTGAAVDGNRAPSPPLSLKARETASLSLKRIFEKQLQQQRSSSDDRTCSSAQYINVEDVVDVHLVNERQAMHMAVPAEPDLDLKLATLTATATSYTKSNDSTSASRHDERKVDGGGGGQLTIFYAGTVCVYEDVSVDKAKAILLLASGSGDVYRSNYANNLASRIRKRPISPPPRTPETAAARTTRSAKAVISRSQAELPFARKASLARFLEKRKERVEEKVGNTNKHATSATIPPQKKLCSSSPMHLNCL